MMSGKDLLKRIKVRMTYKTVLAVICVLVLSILCLLALRRPAGNAYKTDRLIPKIGSMPVYAELKDGEEYVTTYTPDNNMTVVSLYMLLVNLEEKASDSPYISVAVYPQDASGNEAVYCDDIEIDVLVNGEWTNVPASFDMTAGTAYKLSFTPHGAEPYFMIAYDYEPGISLGFEVNSGNRLTYADLFYHSTIIVILFTLVLIIYIILGRETLSECFKAVSDKSVVTKKTTAGALCVIFLLLLFGALSLDIYKTAYMDGIYITADSDGYLREAVNILYGNGFSYEGLAGYKSHFANWPIIYPAMIAGMMFITGANAYLASKYVAMAVIALILIVLYVEYEKDAWIYALALTNTGFLGLAYNTWSEIPFILFMIIFGMTLGRIVKKSVPKTSDYIMLCVSALATFLTRYFGIYLWFVAGAYLVMMFVRLVADLRQKGEDDPDASGYTAKRADAVRRLVFTALSMSVSAVMAFLYLMMNKMRNGYPTGVSRGTWWDDIATLTDDLIESLLTEVFNVFSVSIPDFIENMSYEGKAWIVVAVIAMVAVFIHRLLPACNKKDIFGGYMNTPCVFIVMAVFYYVIFTAVRYRSSMDTFYFRFFAPATVMLVIGIIGLILKKGVRGGAYVTLMAVTLILILISFADTAAGIREGSKDRDYYDIATMTWDDAYDEIPARSVIIWNPIDYRSSWYRPDVYSGELFMSDTWDGLCERFDGSDYICISRTDAQVIVSEQDYDESIRDHMSRALSAGGPTDEYVVMKK